MYSCALVCAFRVSVCVIGFSRCGGFLSSQWSSKAGGWIHFSRCQKKQWAVSPASLRISWSFFATRGCGHIWYPKEQIFHHLIKVGRDSCVMNLPWISYIWSVKEIRTENSHYFTFWNSKTWSGYVIFFQLHILFCTNSWCIHHSGGGTVVWCSELLPLSKMVLDLMPDSLQLCMHTMLIGNSKYPIDQPCNRLATCPECTTASPYVSWDWPQPTYDPVQITGLNNR